MAETTNVLLEAAGISPKQYGTEISIESQDRSVMFDKVKRYIFPPGQELHIPMQDKRAVTSAATQPTSVTWTALAGTKKTMTNAWSFDGYEIQQQALDSMAPDRLNMNLMAIQESAADAHANQVDSDLLGNFALYGGTAQDATTTFDIVDIRGALAKARIGDGTDGPGKGPFFMVVHDIAWDDVDAALAGINQFRGDMPGDDALGDFTYRKMIISTSGNVPTSTTHRGACFSGGAFGLALRSWIQTVDKFDINSMSRKLVIWSDYAWALVRPGWVSEVIHDVT